MQVSGNVVSVLTNRACRRTEVDVEAAQQQLKTRGELPILTPEQEEIRDRLLAQAHGQLRVARRAITRHLACRRHAPLRALSLPIFARTIHPHGCPRNRRRPVRSGLHFAFSIAEHYKDGSVAEQIADAPAASRQPQGRGGPRQPNARRLMHEPHFFHNRQTPRQPHIFAGAPSVELVITSGRARKRIRRVVGPVFLIGSSMDCDLILGDPLVSVGPLATCW